MRNFSLGWRRETGYIKKLFIGFTDLGKVGGKGVGIEVSVGFKAIAKVDIM